MDRGGHRPGAVTLGRLYDETPGLPRRSAHAGHEAARPGIGLDLRAQEVPNHLLRATSLSHSPTGWPAGGGPRDP